MAFHALANLSDLYDGYCQAFRLGQRQVLLIQEQGRHYIIDNRCPHMDAPLANGTLAHGTITCRAHGIAFDLETGKAGGPLGDTLACLEKHSVDYDGNKIGLYVP